MKIKPVFLDLIITVSSMFLLFSAFNFFKIYNFIFLGDLILASFFWIISLSVLDKRNGVFCSRWLVYGVTVFILCFHMIANITGIFDDSSSSGSSETIIYND